MIASRISTLIFILFSFLLPIFALPITADTHDYNKMVLLWVLALTFFIIYLFQSVREGKLRIVGNRFNPALALLALASVISFIASTQRTIASLTTPLSTTTLVAGAFMVILATTLVSDAGKRYCLIALTVSLMCIAVYTLLMYGGVFPKTMVTQAGNLTASAILLGSVAILTLAQLFVLLGRRKNQTQKTIPSVVFYACAFVSTSLAALLIIIHLFTDQQPILLPLDMGVKILWEIAKSPRTFLVGIGPSHFITAFTMLKPVSINATQLYNVVFTSSSSFLLTLASEMGVLALFAYLLFTWQAITGLVQEWKIKGSKLPYYSALSGLCISQFLLPSSMAIFVATLLLAVFTNPPHKGKSISLARLGKLRFGLYLLPLLVSLALFYLIARGYVAEVYFKRALDALRSGNGTPGYNDLKMAIGLNPYHDRYRVVFSQTNLAIAYSYGSNANLSEEEKQKIPRLAQQAIDEARTAVSLNKTNALNWDNLASIYAKLINFAAGSDRWAQDSYQQKIKLDPKSPTTRISYGGLLFSLQRYQEAKDVFSEAVALKPDFANAHYNLANAQARLGDLAGARASYQTALSLLPKDVPDRAKIEKELEGLGKNQ